MKGIVLITAVFVAAVFIFPGCRTCRTGLAESRHVSKAIEDVLKEHTGRLLSIPGVVGTAEGTLNGRPCIVVYVVETSPALRKDIPDSLEGYPVVIEETGVVRPRSH